MAVTFFKLADLVITGPGALGQTPDQVKALGAKKPLIVTDKPLVSLGIVKKLEDCLKGAGIDYVLYDGVVPNPTDVNVDESLALYKKENCDMLIAIGGGSSMDCAKGCGIMLTNDGDIGDYRGGGMIKNEIPPLIAITTTAGTGSESTAGAVITRTKNTTHHWKITILDTKILPKVAIIDPELMVGMPPAITAATGMDAMTHAVECYVALGAMEYSDALAIAAIKLIFEYLPLAVGNGQNLLAREKMAYAQTMAGMAFSNGGLGIVHSLAHPLSAFYDVPHGDANALLLPWVMDYNAITSLKKFADIAVAAGECIAGLSPMDAAAKGIAAIRRLNEAVGIPATVTEAAKRRNQTANKADLEQITKDAFAEVCTPFNPRNATHKDITAIYELCWG